MRSHRTRSYAALLALVTTTAVAQYTTPSVPSDSRCAGLTGPALDACLKQAAGQCAGLTGASLDSCVQRSRDASPERSTPGRGDVTPNTPGTPRNIVEPTPPARTDSSPSLPSTPRNIVEPATPGRVTPSPAVPTTPRNIVEPMPNKGSAK